MTATSTAHESCFSRYRLFDRARIVERSESCDGVEALARSLPKLVTTSYVFDEVVTFFNSHGHHAKAIELGNRLLNSAAVELVQVDEALFGEGWHYFQKHKDKSYSLTDCISFVLMKGMKIETALTFDSHFIQAGFRKLP